MNPVTLKKISAMTAALLLTFSAAAPNAVAFEWNGIQLTPYTSVSEIYDDNVTFQKDDQIDDFITSLTAGLIAKQQSHLSTFELLGALHYEIFADNGEFDNLSGNIRADWKRELTKYDRIRVRDLYYHTDEPLTFSDAFNKAGGRYSYQSNRFSFDYEHDFTSQWSGAARYENEFTLFSTDLFNDSYMNTGGGGLIYNWSSETRFLLDYDYTHRGFSRGPSGDAHTLSGGVRQYFTKQVYFDGRVGVDFIDVYGSDDITEPRFEARLTDTIDATTTADVAFEIFHSLNAYTQDVFDHWQVSGSLSKEWTKRLRSSFSIFYGDGEYVLINRDDSFFGGTVSFNYDITRNLQGTLKYTYSSTDSSNANIEYQKNVILLGLVWSW